MNFCIKVNKENIEIFGDNIFENSKYIIAFNGRLCNKNKLIDKYNLELTEDNKIIIELFEAYGKHCLEILDGSYSFVIHNKLTRETFIARDRLGIKPLYYTKINDTYIISTKIKTILDKYSINAKIGKDELCELLGLGPAHTPGKTFFKDIYEIPAGHFGEIIDNYLTTVAYWDLHTIAIEDNIFSSINNIRKLVSDSLDQELYNTENVACMLSGGLDSSILTYLAYTKNEDLKTFSINFENNDENFKSNDYQPTKDSDFVKIMNNAFSTNHTTLSFNNTELFNNLRNVVLCREAPGMGDVDSSMYVFCKKIKECGIDTIISGECSDEILCGYPWYYKEHLFNYNGFPWSKSIDARKNIINEILVSKEALYDYIESAYKLSCSKVEKTGIENEDKFKIICYNTTKWFMNTLIERTERLSTNIGLDVRTPFASYKLFEYAYNLPIKHKLGLINDNNVPIEKYLLRKAFENDLPKEIVYRKKSPFPKTYDPEYTQMLENEIGDIIRSSTAPLLEIININYLFEILNTKGENLKENWFGQLMTYPQTLSYLIQINIWMIEYNIEVDI